MSHADEGTLHAYLDGELSAAERAELERHLSVCVPCRAALTEAEAFLTESDGMIRALDVATPGVVTPPRPARRPRVRLTTLAWAASILVAVGLGYSLRHTSVQTDQRPLAVDEGGARVDAPPAPATRQTSPTPNPPAQGAPRGGMEGAVAETVRPKAVEQKTDLHDSNEPAERAGLPNAGAANAIEAAGSAPAPRAARTTAPTTIAMVEGVPVDTTAAHRAFGPPHPPAPRRITMDEAVTHLGGSIRLIDGLTPQRVELLAGVDVVGADPGREVVRIYYEEPDLGLVTLDQQRPGPSFAALQGQISPDSVRVTPVPTADAYLSRAAGTDRATMANLTWRSDGAWLSLTSRLTKDQLAQLQARVK